jgi:hypothetical protein
MIRFVSFGSRAISDGSSSRNRGGLSSPTPPGGSRRSSGHRKMFKTSPGTRTSGSRRTTQIPKRRLPMANSALTTPYGAELGISLGFHVGGRELIMKAALQRRPY